MVVASGQQSLSRRRTERRGMKSGVLQSLGRQPFRRRRIAWSAKGARGAKARVVNQDEQDVRRTCGWPQRGDLRVLVLGIFGIISNEAATRSIRDGKYCSLNVVLGTHSFLLRIDGSDA